MPTRTRRSCSTDSTSRSTRLLGGSSGYSANTRGQRRHGQGTRTTEAAWHVLLERCPSIERSFTNLVEAYGLRALRKNHQLRLREIRTAVDYVERKLKVKHPLANEEFRTDGLHLFVERFGQLINASRAGQITMHEALESYLKRIDYGKDGRAARLYTDSDRRLIVIDPAIRFGRPVVSCTSVPVEMITERFDAGDSVEELASDYELQTEQVEEALRARLRADAA